MPAPIPKDSIARCSSSTSIYDVIRNPRARPLPPKPQVSSPDTIESTQGRLNREVLERFKTTGLRLPHETFVAVVQVGKYVVLAIMLPPYLCLYGLPKWFLFSALPSCFVFFKFQVLKVGQFLMEMSKRTADIMKGLVEQMIGDALKIVKHKTQKMSQTILSVLTFGPKKISKGIKFLQNLQSQAIQNISAYLSKPLNSMLEKYRSVKNRIQSQISSISKLYKKLGHSLQETAKSLTQPLVNAVQPYYDAMLRLLNRTKLGLSRFPKNLKKHVLTPRKLAENTLKTFRSFVVKFSSVVLSERFKMTLKPAYNAVSKLSGYIYNVFTQVAEKMRDYSSFIATPLFRPIQALSEMAQQATYWMWSHSAKAINQGIEFSLYPLRKLKFAFKKMKKSLWNLVEGISRGMKWSFNFTKKACKSASKASILFIRKVVTWILQSPRKLWELIQKAYVLLIKTLKAVFSAGRFFVAMSLAIGQLVFLLIREAFVEMSGWMSKQRN